LTVLARSKFSFEGEISSLFGGHTECPTEFDRPLTDVLAWTGVKLILLGISLKTEWSEAAAENEDAWKKEEKIGWEYRKGRACG
jgi:hypothetical protein